MEISKQQNDARQVHELYWKSYITGDINTLASLLDEHYTQVGSVEGEVFHNKKDAVRFIEETIDQINGKVDMRNRITTLDKINNLILISERCDLYALIDNTWTFYAKFRASTLLHENNGKWLIIHQHSSMPDTRAEEGENIALDKIAAEKAGIIKARVPVVVGTRDVAAQRVIAAKARSLRAPMFLSQAAAPHLKKTGGSIVNITDIHAERPLKNYVVYSVAKAGLAGLTKSLARELGPEVRVNGVAPGAIIWPEDGSWDEVTRQRIVSHTLLKRSGEPDDIARAVYYLIAEAPYVTGQIIAVDGGRSINL